MSCIWRFMYRDVLQPGDTFTMMMRKMVMAMGAISGIVSTMALIHCSFSSECVPSSSFYPRFISYVVLDIGSWIYVKWTHTAPIWLIAFWINSISAITLLNMLACPNGPYEFILIGIMLIVLLCRAHSANLTVPVMALLVYAYNFSFGRMGPPYPLLMLPDGYDTRKGPLRGPKRKRLSHDEECVRTNSHYSAHPAHPAVGLRLWRSTTAARPSLTLNICEEMWTEPVNLKPKITTKIF